MLSVKLKKLLSETEFVSVATCDFDAKPNVAPKFILKNDDYFLYLVDYVIGKTWKNIAINPKVSISTMDLDTLFAYQINGAVEIIEKGPVYKDLIEELSKKQISFSTNRIVEGVRKYKAHENFELSFPEYVIFFKIKIEEIVEIGPTGLLKRTKYKTNYNKGKVK